MPGNNQWQQNPSTTTQSGGGSCDHPTSCSTEKCLIQYGPETPVRKKSFKKTDRTKGADKHRRFGFTKGKRRLKVFRGFIAMKTSKN